ncbi:hypothetical protein [Nocardioides jishulii]|nr:hypothetical protein [Nocardioides jishulii]
MTASSHLVAGIGLTATGILALTEHFEAVPAALVASAGAWWILRDAPA